MTQFTLQIAHAPHRVRLELTGDITGPDLFEIIQHLDEEGVLSYDSLFDARLADAKFSSDDALSLTVKMKALSVRTRFGRVAIVVSNDSTFGMMRVLRAWVAPICEIEPFRGIAPAEAWQGWDRHPDLESLDGETAPVLLEYRGD